jgi:hypothetical protein
MKESMDDIEVEMPNASDEVKSALIIEVAGVYYNAVNPPNNNFSISDGTKQTSTNVNYILWFNETNRELRFLDNLAFKTVVANSPSVNFYMPEQFLFTAKTYIPGVHSEVVNSLVLYYNTIENKFYLLDGFPPYDYVMVESGPDAMQQEQEQRAENRQSIAEQWAIFIAQLKKEGRLTK